jgi:hypothetical protein
VAELALDDDQRHALVGDLDRMGVAQLVRAHSADGRRRPRRSAAAARERPPPTTGARACR